MKKIGVTILLLLFLTGCADASRELERGMKLRSSLLQAESCSFHGEITADYGDKVHSFGMDCKADQSGNLSFTVTSPESISGITGKITQEGGRLTFDDQLLYIPVLTDDQLNPVSTPWIFLKTLRSGCITSAGMEEDLLRLTIDDSYEDDALQLDIWLNGENKPVRAEILYDGKRILSLDVTNFEIS